MSKQNLRYIQNPVKHLRWIFLQKTLIIFRKSPILDALVFTLDKISQYVKTDIRQNCAKSMGLTLSWRRFLYYGNQSIDLLYKWKS